MPPEDEPRRLLQGAGDSTDDRRSCGAVADLRPSARRAWYVPVVHTLGHNPFDTGFGVFSQPGLGGPVLGGHGNQSHARTAGAHQVLKARTSLEVTTPSHIPASVGEDIEGHEVSRWCVNGAHHPMLQRDEIRAAVVEDDELSVQHCSRGYELTHRVSHVLKARGQRPLVLRLQDRPPVNALERDASDAVELGLIGVAITNWELASVAGAHHLYRIGHRHRSTVGPNLTGQRVHLSRDGPVMIRLHAWCGETRRWGR